MLPKNLRFLLAVFDQPFGWESAKCPILYTVVLLCHRICCRSWCAFTCRTFW